VLSIAGFPLTGFPCLKKATTSYPFKIIPLLFAFTLAVSVPSPHRRSGREGSTHLRKGQRPPQRKPQSTSVKVFSNLTPPLSFRSSLAKQIYSSPNERRNWWPLEIIQYLRSDCTKPERRDGEGNRTNNHSTGASRRNYSQLKPNTRDSVGVSSAHRI
jgi:hypothetical protein